MTYNPPYAGGESNHSIKKAKSEPLYVARTTEVWGQPGQVAAILALFAPQEGLGSIQRGHTNQGKVTIDIVGQIDGKLTSIGFVDVEGMTNDPTKAIVTSRPNDALPDKEPFAAFAGAFWRRLEILGYLNA